MCKDNHLPQCLKWIEWIYAKRNRYTEQDQRPAMGAGDTFEITTEILYITAEKIQTTLTRLILHSFNHPLKVGVLPAALHILIMTGYDHHGRHEGDLPMSLLIPEMEEYEHVIDENVPDGW